MKIVTGKTGTPHVTSRQFRGMMEGIIGQDSYIITHGENLEPELVTNNKLKIKSGMMCHHGNISTVEIGTYDEVTIQNGTQGMKRIDLIVNRYSKVEGTGIEENNWVVIQGTPAAEDPVAPAYTEGNLQEGDLVDDCPVFEAHLDGINVTEIVKLLDVSQNMSTLNADLSELQIVGKYSKAFTNKTVQYPNEGRICFKQSDTPPEDIDDTIASFGKDGIITIKRDMTALINVHVSGKWAGLNERCWIYLRDRTNGKSLSQSIQNGYYTTCTISTVQNLTSGQQLEVTTQEAFAINDGLRNNYIEIIPLRG